MKITIAERFHPFSHLNGQKFLLPKSSFALRIFPTRLEFIDLEKRIAPFSIDFSFVGPVREFTAELDLELGKLRVFGRTQEGYMRYVVEMAEKNICLTMEKTPQEKVECRISSQPTQWLCKGEQLRIPLVVGEEVYERVDERMSLGMHKAQEWETICRRLDFKEIFPLWHRLCAWMPVAELEGNHSLLDECKQMIASGQKEKVLAAFEHFFLAAFDGVLVPRLIDTEYQGIVFSESCNTSPLPLLTEGGKLIRSLFFQENQGEMAILPCLPAQFHCGRMVGVKTSQGHVVDFEWTKKCLRRLRLTALSKGEVRIKLPKKIASCRLKIGRKTIRHPSIDADGVMVLELEAHAVVHLDRFTTG